MLTWADFSASDLHRANLEFRADSIMSNLHDAEYQVSDSDLDELDEDELEEEDKGGVGALKGSINKPRHTHISVKTLYGE